MHRTGLARSVAEKVYELISTSGKSRTSTARAVGIPLETFKRRLHSIGNSPFNLDEVEKLARHFGLPVHELVCCEEGA